MIAKIVRHLAWRGRVAAARAEQTAARREAAEHSAAVRRILNQAETLPNSRAAQ